MFFNLLKQFKGMMILTTLASGLSAAASIFLFSLINQSIAADAASSFFPMGNYLLAVLLMVVLGFSAHFLLGRLSAGMLYDMRLDLVRKVLSAAYEDIERIGGHRIYAAFATDLNNIAMLLTVTPPLVFNGVTILLCFGYLAYLSWLHFIVLFLFVIGAVLPFQFLVQRGVLFLTRVREEEDELYRGFKALVEGGKELSLNLHRKRFFHERVVRPIAANVRRNAISAQVYWSLSVHLGNAILFLALGLLNFVSHGLLLTPAEVLIGFTMIVIYVSGPISNFTNDLQVSSQGRISLAKIQQFALAGKGRDPFKTPLPEPAKPGWRSLRVEQMLFHYENVDRRHHFTLGPVDLTIDEGRITFICGGNGSGKSTFAKLLTALYTPHEGRLLLGDRLVDEQRLDWYRGHFSTIFADFFLFEHVLDGSGELAADADVTRMLAGLDLKEKVLVEEGRLSTTALSQGQRKRLALLLAYFQATPIFLFDEWAADQDSFFKEYFYLHLLPELKRRGKTVIAITHDEAYFHACDRLIKFEDGRVVATDGTSNSPAGGPNPGQGRNFPKLPESNAQSKRSRRRRPGKKKKRKMR